MDYPPKDNLNKLALHALRALQTLKMSGRTQVSSKTAFHRIGPSIGNVSPHVHRREHGRVVMTEAGL